MSLNKFITQKHIDKTVDPGSSAVSDKKQEQAPVIESDPISISTHITSIFTQTEALRTKIRTSIENIVKSGNADVQKLAEILETQVLNPSADYSKEQSLASLDLLSLQTVGRAVFSQSDTQASTLPLLYMLQNEVNSLEYQLKYLWNPDNIPTILQEGSSFDKMTQMYLDSQKNHINVLNSHVDSLNKSVAQSITETAVRYFVNKFFSKAFSNNTTDTSQIISEITSVVNTLKTIKLLLSITQYDFRTIWEQAVDFSHIGLENVLESMGQDIMENTSQVLWTGFVNNLQGGFKDLFEGLDDVSNIIQQIPEMYELSKSIQTCISNELGKLEAIHIKTIRSQSVLGDKVQKSIKASINHNKHTQWITMCDQMILQLSNLVGNLNNFSYYEMADQMTKSITTLLENQYPRQKQQITPLFVDPDHPVNA